MTRRARRSHSSAFKAKVALGSIRGGKTLSEVAKLRAMRPNQFADWKNRLLMGAANVFGAKPPSLPST